MRFQSLSGAASRANSKVQHAKRMGILRRIVAGDRCADCGRQATEYDHRDYDKPLDVEMVCHSCNLKRGPAEWTHEDSGIRYKGHKPKQRAKQ